MGTGLIENQLKKHDISTFWFSPWKYSSLDKGASSISRSFLVKMAEKLGRRHEVKNLYLSRKVETQRNIISQFIIWLSLIINFVLFFVLLTCLVYILNYFNIFTFAPKYVIDILSNTYSKFNELDFDKKAVILFTIFGILAIPKLGEFFSSKVRQTSEFEKESSPEQLEETYKNILNQTIKWTWLQKMISIWESTFDDTALFFLGQPLTQKFLYDWLLKPIRINKLVVFVDDLDRCNEDEIIQFLTGMKTFLQDDRVFFILAADINQIEEKLKANSHISKDNTLDYLRKIIQLSWSVPYLDRDKVEKLFKQILISSRVKDNDLINIGRLTNLCLGIQNPRKIKYYIRRLLFIINYYNDVSEEIKLSESDTTLIFKLIIIADLDHELYKQCSNKINYYQTLEDIDPSDQDYSKTNELTIKLKGLQLKNSIQALKIINYSTKSNSIKIDLSKAFELVESSEGEPIKSQEFIKLSATNPYDAVSYLEMVAWDAEELTQSLLGNVIQGIDKLIKYNNESAIDPELSKPEELPEIKNNLITFTLVNQKNIKNINLLKTFVNKLGELTPEIFYTQFDDNLTKYLLDIPHDQNDLVGNLFIKYFENEWFDEYNNFTLVMDKIFSSNNVSVNLNESVIFELMRFIEQDDHFEDIISRLTNHIISEYVQISIFKQFVQYYDNPEKQIISLKLLDFLLNKSDLIHARIKNDIVNHLITKKDVTSSQKTIELFQNEWSHKLSKFIIDLPIESDPLPFFNLFRTIWPKYIVEYSLYNLEFINKLLNIISTSDASYQETYCDLLYTMKTSNGNIMKHISAKPLIYLDFLNQVKLVVASSQIKSRLTRSIKNIKGVYKL